MTIPLREQIEAVESAAKMFQLLTRDTLLAAAETLRKVERGELVPADLHPGCTYCMSAGTPVKTGKYCPECGSLQP